MILIPGRQLYSRPGSLSIRIFSDGGVVGFLV